MNCEVVRTYIDKYLNKEIIKEEEQDLMDHLAGCTACKNEFDILLYITDICGSMEEMELPKGFHEELHQKLSVEKKNKVKSFFNKSSRWRGYAGVAAACLVFAVLSSKLINPSELNGPATIAGAGTVIAEGRTGSLENQKESEAALAPADAPPQEPDLPKEVPAPKNDESAGKTGGSSNNKKTSEDKTAKDKKAKMPTVQSAVPQVAANAPTDEKTPEPIAPAAPSNPDSGVSEKTPRMVTFSGGGLEKSYLDIEIEVDSLEIAEKKITELAGEIVESIQIEKTAEDKSKDTANENVAVTEIEGTAVSMGEVIVIMVPQSEMAKFIEDVKILGNTVNEASNIISTEEKSEDPLSKIKISIKLVEKK